MSVSSESFFPILESDISICSRDADSFNLRIHLIDPVGILGEIRIRSKRIEEIYQRVSEDIENLAEYLTCSASVLEDGREILSFKANEDSECDLLFIAGDLWNRIKKETPLHLLAYPLSDKEIVIQLLLKERAYDLDLKGIEELEHVYS